MTKIQPKKSALILAGAFILLAAASVGDDARRNRGRDAFSGSTGGSGWNSSTSGGGIPGIGASDRPPIISPSH
ncbi:MAG: hypothetical protein ACI8QC_000526 [Planctomycetota bacterium]|jgi:hypothetical protein